MHVDPLTGNFASHFTVGEWFPLLPNRVGFLGTERFPQITASLVGAIIDCPPNGLG